MMTDPKRKQIVTKLEALISALNMGISKLEFARKGGSMDSERADRLIASLRNTREICRRALQSIHMLSKKGQPLFKPSPSGAREYTEMTSVDEYRKFQTLPPITAEDVASVDIDALLKELLP